MDVAFRVDAPTDRIIAGATSFVRSVSDLKIQFAACRACKSSGPAYIVIGQGFSAGASGQLGGVTASRLAHMSEKRPIL